MNTGRKEPAEPITPAQGHGLVVMRGNGPFVSAVKHIEDIRLAYQHPLRLVYVYTGRVWVQESSRWISVVGTVVRDDQLPHLIAEEFLYELAHWRGIW